jgi:hypothetical protein
VACMREEIRVIRIWWERTKEKDHSEDWGVDGRMWSKHILGRLAEEGECGANSPGSG